MTEIRFIFASCHVGMPAAAIDSQMHLLEMKELCSS